MPLARQPVVCLIICHITLLLHCVTQAEYIACFFVLLEHTLLTRVHIDNKSARPLAENQVHHQRLKHIDIQFHWIRDMVADATVQLIDVPTEDQRADFLTKTLRGEVFWRHVRALMGGSV
jgi:hypothetical protein